MWIDVDGELHGWVLDGASPGRGRVDHCYVMDCSGNTSETNTSPLMSCYRGTHFLCQIMSTPLSMPTVPLKDPRQCASGRGGMIPSMSCPSVFFLNRKYPALQRQGRAFYSCIRERRTSHRLQIQDEMRSAFRDCEADLTSWSIYFGFVRGRS
jgi:hypothetical protein